jgi:hypothetical protein
LLSPPPFPLPHFPTTWQCVLVKLCFDTPVTRAAGSELHVCELQLVLDRLLHCPVTCQCQTLACTSHGPVADRS